MIFGKYILTGDTRRVWGGRTSETSQSEDAVDISDQSADSVNPRKLSAHFQEFKQNRKNIAISTWNLKVLILTKWSTSNQQIINRILLQKILDHYWSIMYMSGYFIEVNKTLLFCNFLWFRAEMAMTLRQEPGEKTSQWESSSGSFRPMGGPYRLQLSAIIVTLSVLQ